MDIYAPFLLATEFANTPLTMPADTYSILVPIAINTTISIIGMAYVAGGLRERIKQLEDDFTRMRDSYSRGEDRIHQLAISIAEMKVKLDTFVHQINEKTECPLVKNAKKRAESEES